MGVRLIGIELLVREVGAEHQQDVGLLDGLVPGRESEKSGHPDVEWIVVLDELLASQRMHDRCVQRARHPDQRVVGAGHSRAAEDCDVLAGVEQVRGPPQRRVVGPPHRPGGLDGPCQPIGFAGRREEDLAWHHHDGDAVLLYRGPHRHLEDARRHLRGADQFAVDAALTEQVLGMRFLEVLRPDLAARDVRRDREHRHPAALGVEQSVDQVQVAGAAAARAHRELTGQRCVGGRGERRRLLVPDVLPGDVTRAPDGIGETVEAVAG
jgi:hypothetical protein